jgi:MscS family membrane protein
MQLQRPKALPIASSLLVLWSMWLSAQTNTALPEVEFAQTRYEFPENAGSAAIVVRRHGQTNTSVAVDMVNIGGTAKPSDYNLTAGTIAFAPGETERKLTISLNNNTEPQESRTIKLALSNPAGARLGSTTTAEIFIVDDDSAATWLTFGLDGVPALKHVFGGVPLWQYVASLLYVVLAFFVAKFVDLVVRSRVKAWAERSRGRFDDLFVELLRAPFRMILFVILLHIGLNLFVWPGWFEKFVARGLMLLVALSLTYAALRVIDLFSSYWRQRTTEDDRAFSEQLLPIIRNTGKVFAIIVAVLLTLGNLGVNITSLIASLGIGGLALALAAQDTLSNFFGAIVILTDRPFRIGDRIQFPGVDGTVEAVGFRSTRVRAPDGKLIYIPNKTIGSATIANLGRASSTVAVLNIALPYSTPAEKMHRATRVVEEVLKAAPRTKEGTVTLNQLGDSGMNLQAVHIWNGTDPKAHSELMHELNLNIKRRFEEEGIEFAIPSRVIYVRPDGKSLSAT